MNPKSLLVISTLVLVACASTSDSQQLSSSQVYEHQLLKPKKTRIMPRLDGGDSIGEDLMTRKKRYLSLDAIKYSQRFLVHSMYGDIDINGDGIMDVIISRDNGPNYPLDIAIAKVNQDGLYKLQYSNEASVHSTRFIRAGDVTGNGLDDIFMVAHGREWTNLNEEYHGKSENGDMNGLFVQKDDGTITRRSVSAFRVRNYTHGGCMPDITGNGVKDLLEVNVYHQNPRVLINDGNGNFEVQKGGYPRGIENLNSLSCLAADVNNDGYEDVIMGMDSYSARDSKFNSVGNSYILLLSNGERLVYDSKFSVLRAPEPTNRKHRKRGTMDIKVIDYNNDECIDFATYSTDYGVSQYFDVWKGNCGTGFEIVYSREFNHPEQEDITGLSLGVADLNNDGKEDFFTYQAAHYVALPSNIEYVLLANTEGGFDLDVMTKDMAYNISPSQFLQFCFDFCDHDRADGKLVPTYQWQ